MVETQLKFMSGPTIMDLFTHHANNMSHTISKDASANQLMFAVTAPGHHPDLAMMVFQDVQL
jgi:hypothetical protein